MEKVALTFDDGPDETYTPHILKILKDHHAGATFYMVGTEVEKYPHVVKQVVDKGFSIGNHSMTHRNLTSLDHKDVRLEIEKADLAIERVAGYRPASFRPPYGSRDLKVATSAIATGHHIDMWTIDTMDYAKNSVVGIVDTVNRMVLPGAIILAHCSTAFCEGPLNNIVDALPLILEALDSKGYTVTSVTDLENRPEAVFSCQ